MNWVFVGLMCLGTAVCAADLVLFCKRVEREKE